MGQKQITGPDGKQYYDAPGMTPVPVEDIDGPPKPGMFERAGRMVHDSLPELAAMGTGAAQAFAPETFGASLLLPPLAAGATEAGKEAYDAGSLSGISPGKVLARTGLNAIPGAIGKGYGMIMGRGAPAVADIAGGVAGRGMTGGVLAALRNAFAKAEGGPVADEGAEILGTKLISPEGLEQVKNLHQQLGSGGLSPGNNTLDEVQTLYERIAAALEKRSPGTLAKDVGLPVTTAADRAAQAAAAARQKALTTGQTVTHVLRALLGSAAAAGGLEQ